MLLLFAWLTLPGNSMVYLFVFRSTLHSGCFGSAVCDPECPAPGQVCDFRCECASGFETISTTPLLQCLNINDCLPQPCEHNGRCVDQVEDYQCICPIEWNRGQWAQT